MATAIPKPDSDTLYFPAELVEAIGLSANQINFLKKKGCTFFGRKTSVRYVRQFMDEYHQEEREAA